MRILLLLAVLGQWAVGQGKITSIGDPPKEKGIITSSGYITIGGGNVAVPTCSANSYLSYDNATHQYVCSLSISISDGKTLTQPMQPASRMESGDLAGAIVLSVLFGGGALFGIVAVILDCIKILKVGRTPEPTRCHTCGKSFIEESK